MRPLLLLALAISPATVFGQVSADILGPEHSPPEEIVELILKVEGDSSLFEMDPLPKGMKVRFTEEGHKCVIFSPGSYAKYKAKLIVGGLVEGKVALVSDQHEVTIGDPPTPNPNPNPDPTPVPPNPNPQPNPQPNPPSPPPSPEPDDGRFALAKVVYAEAKKVNRPLEAKAIGDALSRVADNCRSGKTSGVLATIRDLKAELGGAVPPESKPHWKACDELLNEKIRGLYLSAQLRSNTDWADCISEVAKGFHAASQE